MTSDPDRPRGRRASLAIQSGFSLIELLVVIAVIATIAAIAMLAVLQARIAANESAALASLRAIHAAQSQFASSCAEGGYAQSLQDLARPPAGSTAAFISPTLSPNGVIRSGYSATVSPDVAAVTVTAAAATCNGASAPAMSGFFAELHPISVGVSGNRSFAIQTDGAIFTRTDGAPIAPGMAGATILR